MPLKKISARKVGTLA